MTKPPARAIQKSTPSASAINWAKVYALTLLIARIGIVPLYLALTWHLLGNQMDHLAASKTNSHIDFPLPVDDGYFFVLIWLPFLLCFVKAERAWAAGVSAPFQIARHDYGFPNDILRKDLFKPLAFRYDHQKWVETLAALDLPPCRGGQW